MRMGFVSDEELEVGRAQATLVRMARVKKGLERDAELEVFLARVGSCKARMIRLGFNVWDKSWKWQGRG